MRLTPNEMYFINKMAKSAITGIMSNQTYNTPTWTTQDKCKLAYQIAVEMLRQAQEGFTVETASEPLPEGQHP